MIEVRELEKIYPTKERDFIALKDVNLRFEPGEFIAILGESGSGKTTFLNMISGVDSKTRGKILFNELDVDKFNDSKWREIRNTEIGFIFQRFNLIDHLTVMENVVLPLILTGSDNNIARDIARRLLKEVDLEGIEDKLASELSGGQRQRVAIARTIIINPTIILADEPTGALDSTTAKEILELLQKFSAGRIIIMVTHDEDLAYKNATRVVRLHDGEVISDEVVKERNSVTRDTTNKVLSYETKVTRRLKKRLLKQFPELEGDLEVGKTHFVPLHRKYVPNNPVFTRKIARENYKQKKKINRRILWSFVISISMLLVVNIVMKNITTYNFNLFNINNNYEQYIISDIESADSDGVITNLELESNVNEATDYYEHFVSELYLVDSLASTYLPIQSGEPTYNQGVYSPKMVSLPKSRSNFYLDNQLIAGEYPVADNEIIVSSEFLLVRFYKYSLEDINNLDTEKPVNSLYDFVGRSLYVCGETIIDQSISISVIESNCYQFVISGVLNSYYKGINYSGHIFTPNAGFKGYLDDLRDNKGFTRVDEYYDHSIGFYLNNIDEGININDLGDELGYVITNDQLREYQETKSLEDMLYYMYLAIFFSLIIISGTIDVNIVASSVSSRIKEIGIYSCIGVSKKSIRNMFVFETVETAIRILLINSVIYAGIAFGFKWLYKWIVVDLTVFNGLFGVNEMFSYELSFSIYVILGAVGFLFVSVLVPSFRAANMRAIDALRSG
ncbi:ABC transporter ATP-binding protein YtrE [Candidatus Izimaplasma bacterium HR1]|jgi:ABC-type lipoprotein export system ATPase subunit|uniref:ABC transporter ATP-binding protein/permease n=1 Tax=Candidatus Izimoplasma sp. HR1 TaxID=1541959 RepID=UPI0004F74BCF|nr:ABC transporter ATP-binding protein YtrE [Candidatus Izimaplasma bacterium HR1]